MTPTRRRYDTDLSDAEWAFLAPLLPPEKPDGRHRENDLREVIHGIRYVLRTGAAWRHVPHDFPTGISVINGSDAGVGTVPGSAGTICYASACVSSSDVRHSPARPSSIASP